jgi:hypothetical protein
MPWYHKAVWNAFCSIKNTVIMPFETYQLKIELLDTQPLVMRRIVVNPDILLVDLHRVIQTTMGWFNSHIHLFQTSTREYSPREFEVEDALDSRITTLKEILSIREQSIRYLYDFGDYWMHVITLEEIDEQARKPRHPVCLLGANTCPPEDCGGTHGYRDFRKIMADPSHPEHKETRTWYGSPFNPETFHLQKVNRLLKRENYGCEWIE